MPTVVGVRFKPVTKVYYFLPPNEAVFVGDPVIVETARGQELGWVALANHEVPDSEIKGQLKQVVRRANAPDLVSRNDYEQRREAALKKCREQVTELSLPMKVIDAEYAFDGSRVLFSFSADQRVDFRDLVRVLVRSLRTRVEIRQIGARDEAKIIDGYGRCGRQLCCSSWLTEFHPVSIRMAKNQQLPLAPTEISGVCGRLLCCLAYEDSMYTEMRKTMPKPGKAVETEEGNGRIKGVNILKQSVIVELEESGARVELSINDVTILNNRQQQSKRSQTTKTDLQKPKDQQDTSPQKPTSPEKPKNRSTRNKGNASKPKQTENGEPKSKTKRRRRRSRSRKKQNQPKNSKDS